MYLCLIVYFLILVLGFIFKKNKPLFILQILLIFIMIAFSRGLNDEKIYMNRFLLYEQQSSQTEILFYLIYKWCHSLNMDYYGWLMLIGAIYSLSMGFVAYKLSKYHNLVLSLLMCYSLIMDAIELRQSLAMCLTLVGIALMLTNKRKIFKILVPFIFFLCAFLIHNSAILYMMVIPVYLFRKNKKAQWCYIVFIWIAIFIATNVPGVYNFILSKFNQDKVASVSARHNSFNHSVGSMLYCFLVFAIGALPIIKNKFFHENIGEYQKLIFKFNLALLSTIILIPTIGVDFARMMRIMNLLNFTSIANSLSKQRKFGTITIKNFKYIFPTIVIACCLLYWDILRGYSTLFVPFFEGNVFFKL